MKTEIAGSDLLEFIDHSRSGYEAQLKELVDMPSVSADPACRDHILKTAETAVRFLRAAGATAQAIPTAGNPVVVGEISQNPDFPTVTIYNHLDVQPADASEWKNAPFDMSIDNGVYRGRGTTDDKGPALAILHAAHYAAANKIPINIKFIWELEEEIGSPSFQQFLQDNAASLKTDSVVVSDTIWVSRERPAIPYGLRGLQSLLVRLKTGAKDVHSGLTGGLARNPIGELAQLIGECYDAATGKVKIPGFYDDVREPSGEELDSFLKSGFTVEGFKKAHELSSVRTSDSRDGAQRIWAQPTFEVHGIVGGYTGPGVKTIVPHQAEAKISTRLVPDQNPNQIFDLVSDFIKARLPDAEIIKDGMLFPYRGETSGAYAEAASLAMKSAFGVEPAFTREGGSIGAVLSMHEVLNAPVIFLGLSLPEHGYHAINENFDWQQASGGIRMFVDYFRRLSEIRRS